MYKIKEELFVFDFKFNEPISNELLDSLTNCSTIIFYDFGTYESTMKNYSKLYYDFKHKRFKGSKFNQPINNLQISIKKIFLGYSFDCPLDNLPTNLKILKLGCNYNQSLDYLPDSLKVLILNNNISSNYLPKHIQIILYSNDLTINTHEHIKYI